MLRAWVKSAHDWRDDPMNGTGKLELPSDAVPAPGTAELDFLPPSLVAQCQILIESYHKMHGYRSLPDILWKFRLGPFIETHRELRELLRKASTTRSAKKSNAGFANIAAYVLSLEILASHFVGWNAIYPEAAEKAQAVLKRHARLAHMPLIEFYLYPSRYPSQAALSAIIPPNPGILGMMDCASGR
jgi:hypothetical protein